jgi:hypothetical protein
MRSWHNADKRAGVSVISFGSRMTTDAKVRPCCGRLRLAVTKGGKRALFSISLIPLLAIAQSSQKQFAKPASTHRANEMTLAGLRPGRDNLVRAAQINKAFGAGKPLPGDQTVWYDPCRDLSLIIDTDKQKLVQVIRAGMWAGSTADCAGGPPSNWKTGLGLRVGDATGKLQQLYGPPDSKSPSTRNGQPLELWYYAFDWAGENVPQVMEVLCTRGSDGKPGQVVEITLAAPSL